MSCNIRKENRINKLVKKVVMLKKSIKPEIDDRLNELKNNRDLFSELCFCLLTANYTAEGGIQIQRSVDDFSRYNKKEIEGILRKFGYRFPAQRAKRIAKAKKIMNQLNSIHIMKNSQERREWLVETVDGIGYKEASHFLRNIGYFDVAIIDRHIISVLVDNRIIENPKTLTPRRYLEIERKLMEIANKTGMEVGELDFYLWYMKTGKILK